MKFSINKTKAGLGELQTTLHWVVSIAKPAEAVGEFEEDLQIRVQTSGVPVPSTESTPVELQGHTINYNGKTSYNGELPWTFVEGTDGKVIAFFSKWVAKRWAADGKDVQGKQELTEKVKADLKLELLGPDDEVTRTYTLVGAMPKIDSGNELGQSADAWMENITWTYDHHHLNVAGEDIY